MFEIATSVIFERGKQQIVFDDKCLHSLIQIYLTLSGITFSNLVSYSRLVEIFWQKLFDVLKTRVFRSIFNTRSLNICEEVVLSKVFLHSSIFQLVYTCFDHVHDYFLVRQIVESFVIDEVLNLIVVVLSERCLLQCA